MALRTPLSVTPHLYMGDSTGRPLDKGVVYFGEQDKDPEFYPINLFSDDALTKPLAQPVHTKGGYLYDKGDMVEPHAKELIYSVKVLDSYGRKVFYKGAMMRNSWNDDVIEQINTAIIGSADAARQVAIDITNDAINNTAVEGGVLADTFVVVDGSLSQRTINKGLESIADLSTIKNPKDGLRVYVKSYHAGLGKGGGYFVYDSSKSALNDGGSVFNGWVREISDSNAINVFNFGILNDGVDYTDKLTQAIANNPEYSTFYFPDGTYAFNGLRVEKNGVKLLGQSKENTVFKVSKADTGLSIRFGKRGPSSDYRDDNLPVYNGVNPIFDINDYSPGIPGYPRYKDMRIDNLTIELQENCELGLEFYRCDGGGHDVRVTHNGSPAVGNVIRHMFCVDQWVPEIYTSDFPNATYNTFFYWSYGIKGRTWDVGYAQISGFEFKHGVNCHVQDLRSRGADENAVNIGYGSNNIRIDNLSSKGHVRIKNSEEFNFTRNINIGHLEVKSQKPVALTLLGVDNLHIGTYDLYGRIYIPSTDFYSFSDATPVVASKNSDTLKFDGNYDRIQSSSGFQKYFYWRFTPTIQNSSLGTGTIRIQDSGGSIAFLLSKSGGIGNIVDTETKKVKEGLTPRIGFELEKRVYDCEVPTKPYGAYNVDFGNMTVVGEQVDPNAYLVNLDMPMQNCKGEFYAPDSRYRLLVCRHAYQCNIKLRNDKTSDSLVVREPILLCNFVDSALTGSVTLIARMILIENNAVYSEGIKGSKISLNANYPYIIATSPPITTVINNARSDAWEGGLDLSGTKFTSTGNTNSDVVWKSLVSLIIHTKDAPSGFDLKIQTGVVARDVTIAGIPYARVVDGVSGSKPTGRANYPMEEFRNIRVGVNESGVNIGGSWLLLSQISAS